MVLEDLEALRNLEIQDDKSAALSPIASAVKEYVLEDGTYRQIMEIMLQEMEQGLARSTNPSAKVKMFPTYVRGVPDGSETGDFLALDLGGTNFRVLSITLKGNKAIMKNKIFPISQETMTGPGEQLFDHIASCIEDFMRAEGLIGKRLPLGFTFSFPLKQEGLNSGRLVTWTKGFTCAGVEGEDVVKLLHAAIKRKGDLGVECVAVLNDTVGCLMSCAFLDHTTEIGVILGTGTNACYMEKLERVGTWDGDNSEPKQVIINCEWGAFGDNGCIDFIRSAADRDIDESSLNAGKQLYEKMISGMYMGEIARQVIVHCASQKLLFGGNVPAELATRGKFFTKYVSEIEADTDEEEGFPKIKQVLDELGLDTVTIDDCKNVQYICAVVSRRAAFLSSAGIATLINRINKPSVTVAVDGSLYRYHPHFHNLMMQKIQELINPGIECEIKLSEDGSGRGAALVAAFRLMLSEDGSGKGAALVAAVSHRICSERQ